MLLRHAPRSLSKTFSSFCKAASAACFLASNSASVTLAAAAAPVSTGRGARAAAASYQREGLSRASSECPCFSPAPSSSDLRSKLFHRQPGSKMTFNEQHFCCIRAQTAAACEQGQGWHSCNRLTEQHLQLCCKRCMAGNMHAQAVECVSGPGRGPTPAFQLRSLTTSGVSAGC